MNYDHRQFGTLMVGLTAAATLIVFAATMASGAHAVLLGLLLFFAALLLLFSSLRVRIDDERVRLGFGIGVVHKTFAVADIVNARRVRNPWWYGFGIRLTPHGWMFNVSGLDAVEITLRSGRHYRIGTDEPRELEEALQRVIAA